MASAFGHVVSALALGRGFPGQLTRPRFWILGAVCSVLPDADVVTFRLGIAYESMWGHRGFSHSLLFALIVGILFSFLFYGKNTSKRDRLFLAGYFFIGTASHAVLDAMTNGGLGVAFFAPFDNSRYFFPWRPIQVSPLGIGAFFGEKGLRVLLSEFLWIGIPALLFTLIVYFFKRAGAGRS